MLRAFGLLSSILFAAAAAHAASPTATSPVELPAIGCPTTGQDEEPAPKDGIKSLSLDPVLAGRLAWYGDGVLAPRGWHCLNLISDSGTALIVSERPFRPQPFAHPMTGPLVTVSFTDSAGFGRFEIAMIAARYFPRLRPFVARIMAEDFVPRREFVFHPYRSDRFITRRADLVEIENPPFARAGTDRIDGYPVRTRMRLFYDSEEPALMTLTVKLPRRQRDLLPTILASADPGPDLAPNP